MHYRRFRLYGDPNITIRQQRRSSESSEIILYEHYAEVELTQDKWATIDLADVPNIEGMNWYYSASTGYAYSGKAGTSMQQHLLDKAPFGHEIDHQDRDKLNNRRKNISFQSQSNNAYNKAQTDNAKHVSFHRASGKYQAYITMGKYTQIYLGLYLTEDVARRAHLNGIKLFVQLNFDLAKFKPAWKLMRLQKQDTVKADE